MVRRLVCAVLAATTVGACDGPTVPPSGDPDGNLDGLWTLQAPETPVLYGLSEATLYFRADGTFHVLGTSSLSSFSNGRFEVEGTWSSDEGRVELTSGVTTQSWNVLVGGDRAFFTSLDGQTKFRIDRF